MELENNEFTEEIAGTVAFFASSEAQYINGANISVDNGAMPTI